ncbi:hypothetical protein ACI2KV_11335 [Micromonospora chokoriensis]
MGWGGGAALGGDGRGQRGGEAGDCGFAGVVDRDGHGGVADAQSVDVQPAQFGPGQRGQPDRAAGHVRVEAGRRLEQQHRAGRGPRLWAARGRVRHRAVQQ